MLLKSLIGILNDDGVVESQKLERLWQDDVNRMPQPRNRRTGAELGSRIIRITAASIAWCWSSLSTRFPLNQDGNFDRGIQARAKR